MNHKKFITIQGLLRHVHLLVKLPGSLVKPGLRQRRRDFLQNILREGGIIIKHDIRGPGG